MSDKKHRNSDLVECGIDEYAEQPKTSAKKTKKEEPTEETKKEETEETKKEETEETE